MKLNSYQAILGMSWLITENPTIDWRNRKVLFKSNRTKKVSAPQREQVSKVQKCHIVNDYSGETKKYRKLMLSNCSNIDILNSINYST